MNSRETAILVAFLLVVFAIIGAAFLFVRGQQDPCLGKHCPAGYRMVVYRVYEGTACLCTLEATP